jgi:hypothetical protein
MKRMPRLIAPLAAAGLLALTIALLPWEQVGAPLGILCLLAACAWLAIRWVEPRANHKQALTLFFGSLFLRLTASGLYAAWVGAGGWLDDAIAYDRVGWALAQAWKTGAELQGIGGLEWVANEPFARIVAAVYWVVGHSPAAVIVLNAVLGASAVYLTYRLGSELLGEPVGRLAGWMCALYTGFWVYSLMPLKDSLIMASTFFFFWTLQRLTSQAPSAARIIGWGGATLVAGVAIVVMRDYVFIVAGLGGAVYLFARAVQAKRLRWFLAIGLLALAVALFPIARRLADLTLPLGNFGAGSFLSGYFGDLPPSSTVTGLITWGLGHPLSFATYLGLSLTSTVLAPYAWIVPGAIPAAPAFGPYTVGFPGMWLWYLVLPFAVLGVGSSMRRSRGGIAGLLTFAALLLVLFSLTIPRESRHRDLIMPVFLLLASAGLEFDWRLKRLAWFAWVPLLFAAVVKLDAWVPLLASAASAAIVAAMIWIGELRKRRRAGAPLNPQM